MSISMHVEDKSIIHLQKKNYEYCRFSLTTGIGLQTHFICSSQYSNVMLNSYSHTNDGMALGYVKISTFRTKPSKQMPAF